VLLLSACVARGVEVHVRQSTCLVLFTCGWQRATQRTLVESVRGVAWAIQPMNLTTPLPSRAPPSRWRRTPSLKSPEVQRNAQLNATNAKVKVRTTLTLSDHDLAILATTRVLQQKKVHVSSLASAVRALSDSDASCVHHIDPKDARARIRRSL